MLKPPTAIKIPKDVGAHGVRRVDDYYWMRDRLNPALRDHLAAENEYAQGALAPLEQLRSRIYDEMLGRIEETDQSVPARIDDYFYYTRTEAGRQYAIHCRRRGSMEAPEEVVLDENVLASEFDYCGVGAVSVSPDHRLLAYTVDVTGSEAFDVHLVDLAERRRLPDQINNACHDVVWANDNRHLFYVVLDAALRPFQVYRHRVGRPAEEDALVFHEIDEAYFIHISKTRSRRFIVISSASKTTTEVRTLGADEPGGTPRLIQERRADVEYYVDHCGDRFFVLTNDRAKDFKVVSAPIESPGAKSWETVVPHDKDVKLDAIDAFAGHLVVYERIDGIRRVRVVDLKTGGERRLDWPETPATIWGAENPEFDSTKLRFNYSSLVTPRTVVEHDMIDGTRTVRKRYAVIGGYEASAYATERIYAAAKDGTRIPISLVYRNEMRRDGGNPLLLYGYGAYGTPVEPVFSSNRLSFLDRGAIFAIAHVRGGGEMGRAWYEHGKLLYKRNSFADFIACAEHLVRAGYAEAGNIAIAGGSAGGLLVGAVANMRPDLVAAVVAQVPFVDALTTMMDASIPLTVTEYDEWGNPADKIFYEYLRSYSPYDNVKSQSYPAMLVTAGLNDPRVQYWEPVKWVARIREVATGGGPWILKVKMGEGHSGASGRYDYLREVALDFAFLLDRLGLSNGR